MHKLFFFVPFFPILLAILLRFVPIQGPRKAFDSLWKLINILPHLIGGLALAIVLGFEEFLILLMVLLSWLGVIFVPLAFIVVLGVLLLTRYIVMDHVGIELNT